jgi:hypothetical protein
LAALYGHVSDVLTIPRIGALLGLVVIVLVGAVGGWGGATEAAEEAPTAAVGTPIEAEPFEVTVRRARFFDELRPSFYAEDGFRYLALRWTSPPPRPSRSAAPSSPGPRRSRSPAYGRST